MKIAERLASLSPAQLHDARVWLSQNTWRNLEAEDCLDPAEVSDAEVVYNLGKIYDGGWPQFLKDSVPV